MSVAKRDLEDNRKVTTHRLIEMKQRGEKISMYSATSSSRAYSGEPKVVGLNLSSTFSAPVECVISWNSVP